MKAGKNLLAKILVGSLFAVTLAGCGNTASTAESGTADAASSDMAVTAESAEIEETVEETVSVSEEVSADAEESVITASSDQEEEADSYVLQVGSLKGPTTMGLVNLMQTSEAGESEGSYSFTMLTQPDELAALVVKGDVDIALVPANLAAVLYNKTEGGISVIGINTLGVLDVVTGDESITSIADLSGKTLYTTGQGATPEYAINYLLEQYGVTDCTVEFKSEATEVAAVLASDSTAVGVLPQPFATAALIQNESLHIALSLTDAWDEVTEDGSSLITGVTIVRNEVLTSNVDAVNLFLTEASESAAAAVEDVEGTAELVASYGIVEKAPVAQRALPSCNIVSITGEEMKEALRGYLQVLFEANAESVGGELPGDDFYFIG